MIVAGPAGSQQTILAPTIPWSTFTVTAMDFSPNVSEVGVAEPFTAIFFDSDGTVTSQDANGNRSKFTGHFSLVVWVPSLMK